MINILNRDDAIAQGLSNFFDGVPCPKGHLSQKKVKNRECAECARLRASAYYHANRDKVKAKRTEEYATNNAYAQAAKDRASKRRAIIGAAALREKDAAYYAANQERVKTRSREWSAKNRERKAATNKAWNAANQERARLHQRTYEKRRRDHDPVYAMKERIGSAIRQSLINGGYTKKNRVSEIIGCTFVEFASHIERQFSRGMSWDNRAQWHIDHIIPISSARSEADVIRLHHFTNLRPLWAHENAAKSDKLELLV